MFHFLTDTMKRTYEDYFSDSDDDVDQALARALDRTEQIRGCPGPPLPI